MNVHCVAVHESGEAVQLCGDPELWILMHSVAKPLQLIPLLDRGLDLRYGLTEGELVLLASSHLAQPQHLEAFYSVVDKTGLHESDLILPPAVPHGRLALRHWQEQKKPARRCCHPCAGTHLAMMLLQRELTGAPVGYAQADSPAQREILQYVRSYCDEALVLADDRCGVPTYGVPLSAIAAAYCRLAVCCQTDVGLNRFVSALHAAPVMIEGDGCIATVLASNPNLIAKTGVTGILAVGLLRERLGIAIFTQDGWYAVVQAFLDALQTFAIPHREELIAEIRKIEF